MRHFTVSRPALRDALSGVSLLVLLCGAAAAQTVTVGDGQTVINTDPVTQPVTVSGNGWTFTNNASITVSGAAVIQGPISGESITVNNKGPMSSTNFGGAGMDFTQSGNVSVFNISTISVSPIDSNSAGRAVSFGPGVDGANVVNFGTIKTGGGSVPGSAAIAIAGAANVKINNAAIGVIASDGNQSAGSGISAIAIGNGYANGAYTATGAVTINNFGTIRSGTQTGGGIGGAITIATQDAGNPAAVGPTGVGGVTITNYSTGTITGGAGGVAIDNSANSQGIVIDNQGTIVGSIRFGTGNDLLTIRPDDEGTPSGPVGDVIGRGAGTVRFDAGYVDGSGPVAYTYSGTISNVAQIDVATGEITFTHAPTQVRDFRIEAGGRAVVNENFTHTGTLTVSLPSKSDGATALLQVNGVANLGGATVRLDVADAGVVGRATKIVSATGGLIAPAAANVVAVQSTLYNVTVTATSTDLIVTPTIRPAEEVTVASDARASMPAFAAMLANGANDPAVARVAQAFSSLSAAQQQTALVQLAPNTATMAGAARQGVNTSNQVNGVVAGRQRAAREDAATGMSAGNQPGKWTVWAQGYGGATTQGPRDGFDGFTTSSYGGAVGADRAVTSNVRVGVAANVGHGEIDSSGTRAGDRTKVDNYGVTLYGSLNARHYYVDGAIGGAYNRNSSRREIDFLGETASGEFDSWQVNARLETGVPLAVPRVPGLTVTPSAFAQYTYLDQAGYTESGAGAASLAVDGLTTHAAEVGVGARMSYAVESAFGTFIPEVRVGYVREVGDDRVPLTTTFTGGGPSFVTNGPTVPKDNVNAGTALTLRSTRGFDLTLNYDYLRSVAAEGHSGYVRVRVPF